MADTLGTVDEEPQLPATPTPAPPAPKPAAAPAGGSTDADYAKMFAEEDAVRALPLRQAVTNADGTSPDRAADVLRLAHETGISADIVGRNYDAIKKRAAVAAVPVDDMARDSPHTAAFLAEQPQHAALAADDREHLGALEWILTTPSRAVAQAINEQKYAALRTKSIFGTLTQEEQDQLSSAKYHSELGGRLGAGESWFKGSIVGGIKMLTTFVGTPAVTGAIGGAVGAVGGGLVGIAGGPPGIIAGAVTGAGVGYEAGAAWGLARTAFESAAASAYDQTSAYKDEFGQALDPNTAKAVALGVGLVNTGLLVVGGKIITRGTEAAGGMVSDLFTKDAIAAALRKPTVRHALAEAAKTYAATQAEGTALMVGQKAVDILGRAIAGETTGRAAIPGLVEKGNIDLYAQPKVRNPDGTTSTVDSVGVNVDGKELLLSTVTADGRHLATPEEAIAEYQKTGKHLGIFDSPASSTAFAEQLHTDYAAGTYEQAPIGEQLLEAAKSGFQAFAIAGAGGPLLKLTRDLQMVRRAEQGPQFFKALAEGVTQSKTMQRAPAAAEAFLTRATKDGPIETIHAPIDTWDTYWQSKGVDPEAMAKEVTTDPEAYTRAKAHGGDLPIATAKYATKLAGTEHNAYFMNELRLLGPDEMNGREVEQIKEQIKTMAAPSADAGDPRAAIRDQITAQLEGAGVKPGDAAQYAKVMDAVSTMAERAGVDPATFYKRYGLTIEGQPQPGPGGGPTEPPPTSSAPPAPEEAPIIDPREQPVIAERRAAPGVSPTGAERRVTEGLPPTGTIAERAAALRAENPQIDEEAAAMRAQAAASVRVKAPEQGPRIPELLAADAAPARTATFLGYGPDGPLYNFPLADGSQSTGGADRLAKEGIAVPETPADTGEKLNGAQLRERALAARAKAAQTTEAHGGTPETGGAELAPGESGRADALRRAGERGLPASRPRERETPAGREARRAAHYEAVFADLLDQGQALRPGVTAETIRPEFDFRVDALESRLQDERESGHDATDLLKTIAAAGGLTTTETTFPGESKHLRDGSQFGRVAGVQKVFTKTGISFDSMHHDVLSQIPRFAWIENSSMLIDAIDNAIRHPAGDDFFPGSGELWADVGMDPTTAWWENSWRPSNLLEVDSFESEIAEPTGPGDTSFNIEEFDQSLFDELKPPDATSDELTTSTTPKPEADTLDTGELQPRLPGDVGDVRTTEQPTPQMEAPFSLTSEIAKPTAGGQKTLFQETPVALTNDHVKAWAAELKARVGRDLEGFDLHMTRAEAGRNNGDLQLDSFIIARGAQRAGLGSMVMQELTRFADLNGKRITLSPAHAGDIGPGEPTSRGRLVKFYKRFGFVENKGRYRDFSHSAGMYREPTLPGRTLPQEVSGPLFFSRLTRAVETMQQASATGDQWVAAIRNAKIGINRDEFAIARVEDLQGPEKYTKQEVLAYLAANEVHIADVTLGEGATPEQISERTNTIYEQMVEQKRADLERRGDGYEEQSGEPEARFNDEEGKWEGFLNGSDIGGYYDTEAEAQAAADAEDQRWRDDQQSNYEIELRNSVNVARAEVIARAQLEGEQPGARYGQYTLPGAEPGSYREVFLTVPDIGGVEVARLNNLSEADRTTLIDGGYGEDLRAIEAFLAEGNAPRARSRIEDILTEAGGGFVARGAAADQLARERTIWERLEQDLTWQPAKGPGWSDGHEAYDHIVNPIVRVRMNTRQTADGRVLFLEEVQPPVAREQSNMPPLLLKNWRELAFKWALRHAVDEGLDGVAWTSGEMQAARYSLEQHVDEIHYSRQPDGTYHLSVWKGGRSVDAAERMHASLADIEGLVGKDIAKRIENTEGDVRETEAAVRLRERGEGVDVVPIVYVPNRFRGGGEYVEIQPAERQPDDPRWGIRFADGSIMGNWPNEAAAESNMQSMNRDLGAEPNRVLTGDNLKIGGAGLKRLYDVDFKNVVQGLPAVKKNGGKVDTVDIKTRIPTGERIPDGAGGLVQRTTGSTAQVPALQITPELRKALLAGQALFQEEGGPGGPPKPIRRGAIRFGPDRQISITLLERADKSTFLHEVGHFFLRVFTDLADHVGTIDEATRTPQQAKLLTDHAALTGWLGATDGEFTNAQHEQFARGFEAYLRDGQAPSLELQGAFARYRAWLTKIYQSLVALNVNLTPEVRGVMDRMLATDAAIAEAEAARGVPPLFKDAASAGMTAEEFTAYTTQQAAAATAAREQLDAQVQGELVKQAGAEWQADRATVKTKITAEVQGRPVYRVLAAMQHGQEPDGTPIADGEALKLSRRILVDRYGEARVRRLPRSPYIYRIDGGLDPDHVAELYGFSSGDAMLSAIEQTPAAADVIEAETNRRMVQTHGDTLVDGTLPGKAKAAISNTKHDDVVRAEMKALWKQRDGVGPPAGGGTPEQKAAAADRERAYERRWFEAEAKLRIAIAQGYKQVEIDKLRAELQGLKQTARGGAAYIRAGIPPASVLRDAARERIANTPIRAINPDPFWSASRRAGLQAMERAARQDLDGAIVAKQQELINLALYREAQTQVGDIEDRTRAAQQLTGEAFVKRLQLNARGHLDQINGILDRFGFGEVDPASLARRPPLHKFVAALEGMGLAVDLPDILFDEGRRTNYKELTLTDFQAVTDGLTELAKLAGDVNRLIKLGDKADLDATAAGLAGSIRERVTGKPPVFERDRRTSTERNRMFGDFIASHRKIASYFRQMDGGQDGGPMVDFFMRALNDAGADEAERTAAATRAQSALWEAAYPRSQKRHLWQKQEIPAIGQSLSKMERLMIALTVGNESGRDRIIKGEHWAPEQLQAVLDTLDARDLTLVQGIFDHINSYKQDIVDKQTRVYGFAPEMVEATPITAAAGTIPGGYFPLKYDDRASAQAASQLDYEAGNLARLASYAKPTTKRGFTIERVENVKLPVRRDVGVIFQHLKEVIHDLTHHETLIDIGRVLGHPDVQQAIYETYGDQVYRQIKNGIRDVAFGDIPAANGFQQGLNSFRAGTTISGLGWSLTTAMLHLSGAVPKAIHRVGPASFLRGLTRWARDAVSMENTAAWINEVDPTMRNRGRTMQRELNEVRNSVGVETGRLSGFASEMVHTLSLGTVEKQKIVNSYFYLLQQMQRAVDIPTWLGQYHESMDRHGNEPKAIAEAAQAVLDSAGGGQIKDLAGIQRGGPMQRLWTNFYSTFNVTHNLAAESFARTSFTSPLSIGHLAVDYLMLYTVPATLGYYIHSLTRKNKNVEDAEGVAWELAKANLAFMMETIVGVRDLAGIVEGYDYKGPPGLQVFPAIAKLMQQTRKTAIKIELGADTPIDAATLRALNEAGGIVFHYPAGQVGRTLSGVAALADGTTQNPGALIVGAPKNPQ